MRDQFTFSNTFKNSVYYNRINMLKDFNPGLEIVFDKSNNVSI
jgi:hypothetical protein